MMLVASTGGRTVPSLSKFHHEGSHPTITGGQGSRLLLLCLPYTPRPPWTPNPNGKKEVVTRGSMQV